MRAAVVAAAVVALLSFGACARRAATHALPPEQGARSCCSIATGSIALPQKVDDKLHVYRFVPSMGGGVFQDRTLFFGTFELFTFEADGQRIRFNLLAHAATSASRPTPSRSWPRRAPTASTCKLTITDDPRGPKSYYGWRNEGKRPRRAAGRARRAPTRAPHTQLKSLFAGCAGYARHRALSSTASGSVDASGRSWHRPARRCAFDVGRKGLCAPLAIAGASA